ncbi:rRNA maturation RNase YbeY [Candidatus Kaiserbacteria bacterium RIFCSPHIGHO2_12_FULL_53_13]|uniref:Endoribonuclease YbeY n=1 Tax=Candidatus Kaiserbacteria bacterium RIFCSPHIGHO2_12_FULL_53_13 TaxID=1798502 RepID=A0A1F6EAI0_9BACT|nr:MAG: rRNA maturation RNase YbeY [Candidatus Kaiserbacteria bacterium RIFCSPHIGHO2_12_FULL_53_13]OGG74515.1 MAG: rRNA maturation RNase YbeY [Candidatus Kaiserbacteria bacterium RIFCSPLOWO2_01_FULL_52_36]
MKQQPLIEIARTIRGSYPRVPFEKIAREILGRGYALSLVLCADTLARRINRTYRKKEYTPNVLSFSLGRSEGEIFLNVRKAARESVALKIAASERVAHLFIHGCLHLKGHKHSDKMDSEEIRVLRQFGYRK